MIQGLFTKEAIPNLTVYTLKMQPLAKISHGKESILITVAEYYHQLICFE